MIDKESRNLLLKEVLVRATKEEKLEHEKIMKKRNVLSKLAIELQSKWHELLEREKRNEYPKDIAYKQNKSIVEMTMDEFNEFMTQTNSQFEGHFKWANENIAIVTECVEVLQKLLESQIELKNACYEEKWLLLSIALKSQPSLLKYLE
jgi:hypothetical protein